MKWPSCLSSLQAITESYLTLYLRSCVCVCVCEVAHSRMNITSIDQTNVGRKGCRPQQLINIPLITWGTECVCYWTSECRWSPPNSQRCIYRCCPTEELLTQLTHTFNHIFHLNHFFYRDFYGRCARTKGIGKYPHVCICVWFYSECGGFLSVNLASPFLAFVVHRFPSTLSFPKQTESLIGDLKCQQDLWFPVLVTPSLKGLSSVTSLLCCPSWQAAQAFLHHMIHIICILWYCLWPTYSLTKADWLCCVFTIYLRHSLVYSHCVVSLICYRLFQSAEALTG